jgi:hypothetical protein
MIEKITNLKKEKQPTSPTHKQQPKEEYLTELPT